MNHKSIITLLAGVFSFSLFNSLIDGSGSLVRGPEVFFIVLFSILTIACIVLFKREDFVHSKNKGSGFVTVNDNDMYLFRTRQMERRKNLFLKVSIITFLGLFGNKKK